MMEQRPLSTCGMACVPAAHRQEAHWHTPHGCRLGQMGHTFRGRPPAVPCIHGNQEVVSQSMCHHPAQLQATSTNTTKPPRP